MSSIVERIPRDQVLRWLIVIVTMVAAALIGRIEFGFRELVIILLGVVGVVVLLVPGALRVGFYILVLTFAVGWRQLEVTPALKIHPSEVFTWALFLVLAFQVILERRNVRVRFSWHWLFLIGLTGLGIATTLLEGFQLDFGLSVAKGFILLFPVSLLVQHFVRDEQSWQRTWFVLGLVASFVSALGLLEYFFPEVVAPFRGYFGETSTIVSQAGFLRADFSFFGGAITSVFLAMTILGLLNEGLVNLGWQRYVWLAMVALISMAVYFSGNRGPVVALGMGIAIYVLVNPHQRWLIATLVLIVLLLLPDVFFHNLQQAFQGSSAFDSSVQKRVERFQNAWNMAQQRPIWGFGWGASGYVHSDLTQLAADVGFPFTMIFLLWYGQQASKNLWKISSVGIPSRWRNRNGAMLATLAAGLGMLATEGIFVLPHVIAPFWFIVALAAVCPTLATQPSPDAIVAKPTQES